MRSPEELAREYVDALFEKNLIMHWSSSGKTLSEGKARRMSVCSANQYGRERAVADDVNLNYDAYKIDTEITKDGSRIERGFYVDKRDRLIREHAARVFSHVNTNTFRFDNTNVTPKVRL